METSEVGAGENRQGPDKGEEQKVVGKGRTDEGGVLSFRN